MEEYESLDADMTELQDFQCGPSDSISQDDEDEVEELHNSLREVVQDQSVKPKLQCLMVDPSFSMVTVQSEDSGIVWETASSRCSTPWASETSSLSEACSMEGSGAAGKITIVFDEDKVIRRRTRSGGRSSRLGDRLSRPGSSRSASALGVERPEMAEVSLPNVKEEKVETESDLEEIKNKDQQLFSLISEGYEILNIRVPSKLPTVDEEESTEMQDNLSYLDQTPKIRSKNHQNWTQPQDHVLPEDMEILDHQEPSKQDSSQSLEDTEFRKTPTQKESTSDIDYFEKFTLLDEVVPGEQAPELQEEVEHPAAKPQAEEQKPATETATDSQSASEDSFVFVTDEEIVGEHLDEVFYGGGAPANELQQRQDDEAKDGAGMRTRRESQRQLKENGSVLFGSEESVLTPIYISPGPPKIIDPILLEEPTAMSFMYSDLYKDAVGERRRSDEEYSEPESVASEKSFKRSLSDSEEADGYLEKFILKDETPTVEVQSESEEDNKEGKMIWSQSKFEMTGCLTRVVAEEDKDEMRYGEPKAQEIRNEEMREDLQKKGEIVRETEKEREEIQISTVTEEQAVRLASEESIQQSKLTHEVDKETEKTEESVEHQQEEPAEKASEQSVIESEQPCQTQKETKKTAQVLEKATVETAVKSPVSTEVPQVVITSEIQTETTEKSLSEEEATDTEMVAAYEKEITARKAEEAATDAEKVAAYEKEITALKAEEAATDAAMVAAYEKEITALKAKEAATGAELVAAYEKEVTVAKAEEAATDAEKVAAYEKEITALKAEEAATDAEMVAAYEKGITALKAKEAATGAELVAAYEKEITVAKAEEVATDAEKVAAYEKEITALKAEEAATDAEMVDAYEKEITALKAKEAATGAELVAAYEKEITVAKAEEVATDAEKVAAYEKEITALKAEEAATDAEMVDAYEKEITALKAKEAATGAELVAAYEKEITVAKAEEVATDAEKVAAYEKEITALKAEEAATDAEMVDAYEKEITALKAKEAATGAELVAAYEKEITVAKAEEVATDAEKVAAYEKEITALKAEEAATDAEMVDAYEKEITALKAKEAATGAELVAAYEKEITVAKAEEVATDAEKVAAYEKEITALKAEEAATDAEMVDAYEKEITALKAKEAATGAELVAAYEKEITVAKAEEAATDAEKVAAYEKEITALKAEEAATDAEMVAAYEKEITALKAKEAATGAELVAAYEKEITVAKAEEAAIDAEKVTAYEKEITALKAEEAATDADMVAAYKKEITALKAKEAATDAELVAADEKEITVAKAEESVTDFEIVAADEKEINALKAEEAATDAELVVADEKGITVAKTETPAEVKELENIRQEMLDSAELSLEIETSAETSLFKEEEAVAPEKAAPVEAILDYEPVVHASVEITEKTVDEKEIQTKVHIDLQEVTSAEATGVQTAVPEGEKRQEASLEKILIESPTFVPEADQESQVKNEISSEVTEPLMPDEVMTDSRKNQHEILETEQHQHDFSAAGSETEKTKQIAEAKAKAPTEDTRTAVQDLGDELILLVPKGRAVEMDIEIGQSLAKITKSDLSEPDNTCEHLIASENTTICSEALQEAMKETITEPQLEEEPEAAPKQETLLTNELDRSYSPATPVEEAEVEEQKTNRDIKEDEGVFSPLRSFTPQENLSELHREDVEAVEVEEKAEMHKVKDSPEIIVTEYVSPEIDVHREDVEQKIEQDEAVVEEPEVTEEEPEYEMISKQDAREMTEPEIQRDAEEPRPGSGQEREERMEMKAEMEQKVLDLSADEELIEDDYEIIDAEEEIQARLAAELQGMDWFCLTCECLLSKDDCESGEHHSHQVTAVDKAYDEIKERLGDWISELQGRSENIEDLVSELELAYNSVEDHCVETEAEMVVQNEEMMALVMQQYNNMSVNMEEEKKTKLEQLYDQIVSFQESIDTAKATLETTAREAETDARSPEDIHARLKEALESAMSLELGPRGLLVFEDYAKGNSSSSNLTQRKGIPVPQRPTLQPQEPGSATSTNVTVYWKINPGDIIDCFQVYCMEDPHGAVSEEYRVTVKESYCVLEELEPDKTYKVWVMAVNYTGCSLPSERLCFRTAPSVPMIDTERCTVTWDSAMLRWSSGTQTGESYTLEYCRQYELEGEGLRSISGIKSCEHRVLLQPNENYLFYIKAVNEAGASEQSEAALISTKGTRFHLLKASAHPALELSADETTLHYSQDTHEHIPPTDKQCPSILGELLPARGHYYWETIVSGSTAYRLGVAYSTADKNSPLGENNLSWCLQCVPSPSGCRYQLLHNDVQSSLFAMELPERVGILLDYQLGHLSFYNAQSGQLLGTFSQRFTQMCHPVLALEMPGHLEVSMVPEVPEFAKDS